MTDLTSLSLAEARDQLKSRAISSLELTKAHLDAIERAKALNAYVVVTAGKALAMAEASDRRLAKGEGGPLEGLPIGIKDLYATDGVHTQACSHILDGFKPTYESTVTANLWRDGAVMLGKLNMDEFAMGSSNETSFYGPVASPWLPPNWSRDQARAALADPGSAACWRRAVRRAARPPQSLRAFASRRPRATPAARSASPPPSPASSASSRPTGDARAGAWSPSPPRSIRPGRSPARCATRRSCCAQWPAPMRRTSTCSTEPVPDYEATVGRSVKGLTIGVPKEYRLDGMNPEIEALWAKGAERLRDAGANVVDVSLPNTRHALPAYYIVAPAEASSNLARYDGVRYGLREPSSDIVDLYENTRARGFGAEVRRRLMIGTYVLSAGYYDAYYLRAQKIRTLIKRDFDIVFANGVDAILTPATPSPAFGIGEKVSADPVEMYLNDVFTVTVNMAGLPGLVTPAGLSGDGLPLGLQLIGRPFDEETLFALGETLEQAAGRLTPPEPWWP